MLIKNTKGQDLVLLTPKEIVTRRKAEMGNAIFDERTRPTDLTDAVSEVYVKFGPRDFDDALYAAYWICEELAQGYNYLSGLDLFLPLNVIPEYKHGDNSNIALFLKYPLAILEAIGWKVTCQETSTSWFFDFEVL